MGVVVVEMVPELLMECQVVRGVVERKVPPVLLEHRDKVILVAVVQVL